MKKIALCVLASLAVLSGCSKGGSEFEGKWVDIEHDRVSVEIVRNDGNNFIYRETAPVPFSGKVTTVDVPATVKDGALKMQAALGTVVFVIDKSNGQMIGGGSKFKRAK